MGCRGVPAGRGCRARARWWPGPVGKPRRPQPGARGESVRARARRARPCGGHGYTSACDGSGPGSGVPVGGHQSQEPQAGGRVRGRARPGQRRHGGALGLGRRAPTAVVCCEGTVDLWNPKAVRSSAGAVFHVPIVAAGAATEVLAEIGGWGLRRLGTVSEGGVDYATADLTRPGSPSFLATRPPACPSKSSERSSTAS